MMSLFTDESYESKHRNKIKSYELNSYLLKSSVYLYFFRTKFQVERKIFKSLIHKDILTVFKIRNQASNRLKWPLVLALLIEDCLSGKLKGKISL
jgi:hypothetical protein